MFCLFVFALGALVAIMHAFALYAVAFVFVGFALIMLLDPIAARKGQAPLFFAKLRPPQIAIAVVSLAALFANLWIHP